MKAFATLGTAVLFLTLGTVGPVFAQQEHEDAKPEQQQQEHAQPQQQHAHAQPQEHAKPTQTKSEPQQAKQPSSSQQQPKQAKQPNENKQQQQQAKQPSPSKQPQQQQAKQENDSKQQQQAKQQNHNQQGTQHTQEQQRAQQAAWQGHESHNWQADHRTWQQRGGYTGYRIPENRYNGYFGQGHGFVIFNQPYMVVGGFPRFQYNGFWFSLVDPWPNSWANNWYATDSVYVVYVNDGYYMYNQSYPGVGIAISVSM
jgi:hypothetical protein